MIRITTAQQSSSFLGCFRPRFFFFGWKYEEKLFSYSMLFLAMKAMLDMMLENVSEWEAFGWVWEAAWEVYIHATMLRMWNWVKICEKCFWFRVSCNRKALNSMGLEGNKVLMQLNWILCENVSSLFVKFSVIFLQSRKSNKCWDFDQQKKNTRTTRTFFVSIRKVTFREKMWKCSTEID